MALDPFKVGLSILLFLPGFIFVEVREHHLARERKPQFEKTLEIILWSAFIWLIAFALPVWWPYSEGRNAVLEAVQRTARENGAGEWMTAMPNSSAGYFLAVNGWAFVVANLWGMARKKTLVDAVIKSITGRDWYPSVRFRFFQDSLDKVVVVRLDNRRYLGILFSAPDRKDDNFIILKEVSLLPEGDRQEETIEPLPLVESLLLRVDDIQEIQSLERRVLRKIERQSVWDELRSVFKKKQEKSSGQ